MQQIDSESRRSKTGNDSASKSAWLHFGKQHNQGRSQKEDRRADIRLQFVKSCQIAAQPSDQNSGNYAQPCMSGSDSLRNIAFFHPCANQIQYCQPQERISMVQSQADTEKRSKSGKAGKHRKQNHHQQAYLPTGTTANQLIQPGNDKKQQTVCCKIPIMPG